MPLLVCYCFPQKSRQQQKVIITFWTIMLTFINTTHIQVARQQGVNTLKKCGQIIIDGTKKKIKSSMKIVSPEYQFSILVFLTLRTKCGNRTLKPFFHLLDKQSGIVYQQSQIVVLQLLTLDVLLLGLIYWQRD